MTDNRQQELLSAYLDAELSSEQQAEVEQLLATQPEARQLLDDLRALSGTLQSLPRQRVGQDLAAQVLRRAERAMLASAEGSAAEVPPPVTLPVANAPLKAESASPKVVAGSASVDNRPGFQLSIGRRRRGWVWAALTLAAALLLLVYDRSRIPEQGQELAKGPQAASDQAAFESRDDESETKFGDIGLADQEAAGKSSFRTLANKDAESDSRGSDLAGRATGEATQLHADSLARSRASEKQAGAPLASGDMASGDSAPDAKSPAAPGASVTTNSPQQDLLVQNGRAMKKEVARQGVADNAEGGVASRETRVARGKPSPASDGFAQGKGVGGQGFRGKNAADKDPNNSEAAAATAAPVIAAPAIAAPAIVENSAQRMIAGAAVAEAEALSAGAPEESTEILVVQLHVTAEALRDGVFEQVMADHNIRWETEAAPARDADRLAKADDAPADKLQLDARADAQAETADRAGSEPAAKRAAMELFKQIAALEHNGPPAADPKPSEESVPTDAPVAEALTDTPAKAKSLKAEPRQATDAKKLAERRSTSGLEGKADGAAKGDVAEATALPGPQYAVLVEAPAAHVQQTLAHLAADARFLTVEIQSSSESTGSRDESRPLGGGNAGNRQYLAENAQKMRGIGAPVPVDGDAKGGNPKGAPAVAGVKEQPAPASVPANAPTDAPALPAPLTAAPKSNLKPQAAELRSAGQLKSGAADEQAKRAADGPESVAQAWRIELPRQEAEERSEVVVDGVAAKRAFGRANTLQRDAERLERKATPTGKGEQSAAATAPKAPDPLTEKSKSAPPNDPAAPVASAALAQTATLGITPPQPVRVLFVLRIAAPAPPAAKPVPAETAPPQQ